MDNNIFLNMDKPSNKLLAIPFCLDTTFFSTLNTVKCKEYQHHTWNADLELLPIRNDNEAEKMDISSSDHSQDSVELILEKLLNQNAAGLMFIPESEIVKILQFVIRQKRDEEHKSFSDDMYTLFNIIFSASFDDAVIVKYLRNLNIEETLIALDLLLSYLKQTEDIPAGAIQRPSDLQVVNWMCMLLSSHTEALLLTRERTAKKILKDLKKALSVKIQEYEDLEEVEGYFSILKKNIDILPQQSSVEKYYFEILNIN